MRLLPFEQFTVAVNVAVFLAGAILVWMAGTRLTRYAEAISHLTKVEEGFIGALLLGGITSLPEVATIVAASTVNDAPLAINNLMGGICMQVTILAVADLLIGRQALSYMVSSQVVVLQGIMLVFLLCFTGIGLLATEAQLFWIGIWPTVIFAIFLLAFYLVKQYKQLQRWELRQDVREERSQILKELAFPQADPEAPAEEWQQKKRRIIISITITAIVVLAAGFAVSQAGEALAKQTGLGSSFFGAVFLAVATSLPEVSTTFTAVRRGNIDLAFSNIFGTNLFDVGLIFVADLFYTKGPVLGELGKFPQAGALLGILVTSIYLVGLLVKVRKTVFRMGYDSMVVLLCYAAGLILLYFLR